MKLTSYKSIALILIFLALGISLAKILFWDYKFERFLPKTSYRITYNYSFEGFDEPVRVSTYLPTSDQRQSISEEVNNSPGMQFTIESTSGGMVGRWQSPNRQSTLHASIRY